MCILNIEHLISWGLKTGVHAMVICAVFMTSYVGHKCHVTSYVIVIWWLRGIWIRVHDE